MPVFQTVNFAACRCKDYMKRCRPQNDPSVVEEFCGKRIQKRSIPGTQKACTKENLIAKSKESLNRSGQWRNKGKTVIMRQGRFAAILQKIYEQSVFFSSVLKLGSAQDTRGSSYEHVRDLVVQAQRRRLCV